MPNVQAALMAISTLKMKIKRHIRTIHKFGFYLVQFDLSVFTHAYKDKKRS